MTSPNRSPFRPLPFLLLAACGLLIAIAFTPQTLHAFETKKSSGIEANPSSVDFGNVQIGHSATQTVTLTNTATVGLTIYSSTLTGSGFTTSGLTLPLTLASGQSFTFTLTFAPQASGTVSGNITFSSRNGRSKLVVGLTGSGSAAGTLAVSPPSLSFGDVTVGSNKALQGTLSASGTSVQVSSGTVSTSEFTISGITFPLTIASGASVPFTITFAPQASGIASATASFASDAANSPVAQALTGNGVAAPQHSVGLQWTPSGSQDVVGYNVYRGSTSGGPYAKLNTGLDPTTAYDDISVSGGKTYYYVTTADDSTGLESTNSQQEKATIPTQ
jgi:hypothetical protein